MTMLPRQGAFSAPNLDGQGKHRLSYLDWGDSDNDNIIVCIHGLTRNAHDFDFLARELAKEYRVIAIDMAGRGDSEWLTDPYQYHYGTYMTDCLAFMDNFHLRSVSWIGTSMGGIIGMMIAAMHPGRIKRMVLNDIGAFIPKKGLARIMDYVSKAPHSFSSRHSAEEALRSMMTTFGLQRDEEWQHIFRYSLTEREDGTVCLNYDPNILEPIRKESQNFEQIHDIDLSELWEAITIPTLIIRGAESDLLERETVSAMRSTNIKASSIEFTGIGHAPTLSNQEQINFVVHWFRSSIASPARIQGV